MTDLHVIRYRTPSGDAYAQARGLRWEDAVAEWHRLEDLRLGGALPWVRHFEVRSHGDPTNPTVYAPTRPARDEDRDDYLRLGVRLVPRQRVGTFQCRRCGKVFQGSGLGVGSHNRSEACVESYQRRSVVR